jgi:hypothetical protein
MNTTEDLVSLEDGAITSQPENAIVKPLKFPNQPQEWKIISLRECPTPSELQSCDTPVRVAYEHPVSHSIERYDFTPLVSLHPTKVSVEKI